MQITPLDKNIFRITDYSHNVDNRDQLRTFLGSHPEAKFDFSGSALDFQAALRIIDVQEGMVYRCFFSSQIEKQILQKFLANSYGIENVISRGNILNIVELMSHDQFNLAHLAMVKDVIDNGGLYIPSDGSYPALSDVTSGDIGALLNLWTASRTDTTSVAIAQRISEQAKSTYGFTDSNSIKAVNDVFERLDENARAAAHDHKTKLEAFREYISKELRHTSQQLEAKKMDLEAMQSSLLAAKTKLDEANRLQSQEKDGLAKAQIALEEAKQHTASMPDQVASAAADLLGAEGVLQETDKRFNEATLNVMKAQNELSHPKVRFESASKKYADVDAARKFLNDNAEAQLAQAQKQANARVAEAQAEVAEAQAEVAQANEKVAQAQAEVAQANERVAQAQAEVAQANERVAQAQVEVTQANERVAQAQDPEALTKAQAEFAQANEKVVQAQAEFAQANEKVAQAQAEVTIASRAHIKASTLLARDEEQLKLREDESSDAADIKKRIFDRVSKKQAEDMAKLNAEFVEAEAELTAAQAEFAKASSAFEEAKKQADTVLGEFQEAEAEVNRCSKLLSATRADVKKAEMQVFELGDKCDAFNDRLLESEVAIRQAGKEVQACEKNVATLTTTIDKLSDLLNGASAFNPEMVPIIILSEEISSFNNIQAKAAQAAQAAAKADEDAAAQAAEAKAAHIAAEARAAEDAAKAAEDAVVAAAKAAKADTDLAVAVAKATEAQADADLAVAVAQAYAGAAQVEVYVRSMLQSVFPRFSSIVLSDDLTPLEEAHATAKAQAKAQAYAVSAVTLAQAQAYADAAKVAIVAAQAAARDSDKLQYERIASAQEAETYAARAAEEAKLYNLTDHCQEDIDAAQAGAEAHAAAAKVARAEVRAAQDAAKAARADSVLILQQQIHSANAEYARAEQEMNSLREPAATAFHAYSALATKTESDHLAYFKAEIDYYISIFKFSKAAENIRIIYSHYYNVDVDVAIAAATDVAAAAQAASAAASAAQIYAAAAHAEAASAAEAAHHYSHVGGASGAASELHADAHTASEAPYDTAFSEQALMGESPLGE